MVDPTQQEVKEKFELLTEDEKDLIFSAKTAEKIRHAGKEYLLEMNQVTMLADEVGLIILGFTTKNDLARNLVERLTITSERARNISTQINATIFSKIEERLYRPDEEPRESTKVAGTEEAQTPITLGDVERVPTLKQKMEGGSDDTKRTEVVKRPVQILTQRHSQVPTKISEREAGSKPETNELKRELRENKSISIKDLLGGM